MDIKQSSYAVVIKGTGQQVEAGDRVCTQDIVYNARTGEVIDSTWEKNTPVCTLDLNSQVKPEYAKIFEAQKVGATIVFGIPGTGTPDSSTSSNAANAANSSDSYLSALTIVSVSRDLTRATGTAVANIPAGLPKVTLAKNGAPSIDMNNYKPTGQLVSQTLIQGEGATLQADQTAVVKYTGWLLSNGKQFDSTWSKGDTSVDLQLSQTVKGFQQGLVGQKVGSQVLLIRQHGQRLHPCQLDAGVRRRYPRCLQQLRDGNRNQPAAVPAASKGKTPSPSAPGSFRIR